MRVDGAWVPDEEGILHPVVRGHLLTSAGDWLGCTFLIDTGADRTVISAEMLRKIGTVATPALRQLGGVGGAAETVIVDTRVRLPRADGGVAVVNGPFAAFTANEALELSVIGRDLLGHFAVIVDYPSRAVHLLAGRHHYAIQEY